MPEREKVIKGLECCDYYNSLTLTCFQCPYIDLCKSEGMSRCTAELAHGALALLKEQDTVEHALSVLKAHGWKESKSTYCPNCGAYVEVKS